MTTKLEHSPGAMRCQAEFEALAQYLEVREELADLEARENECTCDVNDFHTCPLCEITREKSHRLHRMMDLWGDNWAVLLNQWSLPFQVWCECGHVSGQHGAAYPHKCAVDNGCEKDCYGFRSRAYRAVPEMLEALKAIDNRDLWAKHKMACLCPICVAYDILRDRFGLQLDRAIQKAESSGLSGK